MFYVFFVTLCPNCKFMQKIKDARLVILALAVLTAVSCSTTKYVPDGMYLLNDVKVSTDGNYPGINTQQMKSYVRQRGNARWFSALKLPLAAYSLSGRDSARWVNRVLRSVGEPPVLFDSLQARLTCDDLQRELQNEGYLDARTELWTRPKGKRMNVHYKLFPGQPYYIHTLRYEVDDPRIDSLLQLTDTTKWGLHTGQQFSVADLDAERKRITKLLTDNGYYHFHKEFITFEADTTRHDTTALTASDSQRPTPSTFIDLTLRLRLYQRPELPDTLHPRYRLRQVSFMSGTPENMAINLRQKVLRENTYLKAGDYYSGSNLQNTYNHLGRLGAVKYTNITFRELPDTTLLDCNIQLQTNKPSTLSFQPEGTNTAGDLGAAASITYQNRNLFLGSENLTLQFRGAYEAIRGLEGYRNQDFVEWSIESRLSFPRFILPFISSDIRRRVNATSEVSLLYDMQDRPEFHRRVLSAAWRYKWNPQNHHDHYSVDLIDLNYVFMPWISQTFKSQYLDDVSSRNAILRYNYEDLFIMKTGFGYTYNNGAIALKTNVETAGNLLSLCAPLFGATKDDNQQYRLFNIAFAQYFKVDFDITRRLLFDPHNQLVFHFGMGVAYPYGNSNILPFEKRYFSGGANSVRGWSVRSLGPGSFTGTDGRIDFINQTGDMKLDLNAEYRTHLFWKMGGALFIDAGNIWTLRNYPDQPGGQFKPQNLIRQMAVSYGAGIRFNFDYFIVRFDLGMKAVNPAYKQESDEHYPLLHPRFSRDYAFHFAVGLPF